MSTADARQRELLRQQCLLRALHGGGVTALRGWAHLPSRSRHDLERGYLAYSANAAVSAERALAARYPTVQALLGDDSFAQLARHLWHAEPAQHGDLAQWGHGLAAFIAASRQLADEPYLADVSRLDAVVHDAENAADAEPDLASLSELAGTDPARLYLRLAPGAALVDSRHPITAIWLAHHDVDRIGRDDRFAAVQQGFKAAAARPDPAALFDTAWVWRDGWQVAVRSVDLADATFLRRLLAGNNLAVALDAAGHAFDFEGWLVQALRERSLLRLSVEPGISRVDDV
jgi:hypothetical protein